MIWTIRQLADEYDVTLRTLRHYEDLRLLAPERRGAERVYHQRDRIRLELILRGKRVGFSLEEIAAIVNMYDEPPGEAGQLRFLLEQIGNRRAQLARMRDDIEKTETELDLISARCRDTLTTLARGGNPDTGRSAAAPDTPHDLPPA